MNIALIYFSATNNTQEIASIIKNELLKLENHVTEFNITNINERERTINFQEFDAVYFGFPVYYWRAPRIAREWLLNLNGHGKTCSVFFTYGGTNIGICHHDIIERLKNQNFKVIATAEFLARHSFNLAGWEAMKDHPNEEDYKIAREYALKTFLKFSDDKANPIKFEKPDFSEDFVDNIELTTRRSIPLPSREGKECSMCRDCETLCPTNAMNADKGKPSRKKCIRCLRCVLNCPDQVLKVKDMSAQFHYLKKKLNLTDDVLRSRKSKFFL
ncbi:MAG: 4Fe-4S ferredoxin [Promethearchaeota archaeon]|nr:MAG: 4Fe-4S ferredoxin [Candidatus Lokiarchaeota archaeon]